MIITWSRFFLLKNNVGRSPTIRTGPYFDHTLRTTEGTYVLFESSGVPKDTMAYLRTPKIYIDKRKEDLYCVAIWLSMYGDEMGEVEIYATFYDNEGNFRSGKKLGVIQGEQKSNCWGNNCVKNDNWVQQTYELPKWENNVQIRIGIKSGGESFSGNIYFF